MVRSSPSKIFRPEAKKSVFASAFQCPRSKCASVEASNFALFAGVRQEPAKRMRQRQGADFCFLFKRSASAMDDVREAELPHCASALRPNSYRSLWFSPAHLLQRVSEPVLITVLGIAIMSKPKLASARLTLLFIRYTYASYREG